MLSSRVEAREVSVMMRDGQQPTFRFSKKRRKIPQLSLDDGERPIVLGSLPAPSTLQSCTLLESTKSFS